MGATTWSGRYDGSQCGLAVGPVKSESSYPTETLPTPAPAQTLGREVGQARDVGARRVRRRLTGTSGPAGEIRVAAAHQDEPPAGEHGAAW